MLQFFNLLNIGLATQVSFSTNKVFQQLQPDQNMMAPELSGIHMNSSFEVPSYFGRAVIDEFSRKIKILEKFLDEFSMICQ